MSNPYRIEDGAVEAADARNRALRTLGQGLAFDALAAAVAFLAVVTVDDIVWSAGYWQALGAALAKTVVVALFSGAARRLLPPKV